MTYQLGHRPTAIGNKGIAFFDRLGETTMQVTAFLRTAFDHHAVPTPPANLTTLPRRRKFVCVVEADFSEMSSSLMLSESNDKVTLSFSRFDAAVNFIKGCGPADTVLVVDVDMFDCTETAVDELINFRELNQDTTVVIGSANFARTDLSHGRKMITDASVRLPCGGAGLTSAISTAMDNHHTASISH